MKQTIVILTALMVTLMMTVGFTLNANGNLSRQLENLNQEYDRVNHQLSKSQTEQERLVKEKAAAAETLQKTVEEREALTQQLNAAVLAAQEAARTVEQQALQRDRPFRE